jgi:CRISPR-associated endonuclease/helicase Cas3
VTGVEPGGFDSGAVAVYGEYMLSRTHELLRERESVTIPRDIPALVEAAYDGGGDQRLYEHWCNEMEKQRCEAEKFKIVMPSGRERATIVNWLYTGIGSDPSGKRGERAVRDTEPTIEVLTVFAHAEGFTTIDGTPIPVRDIDDETARHLARQSVRLPVWLSVNACIEELEDISKKKFSHWQQSTWLKGELFLVFDENGEATLNGCRLRYSKTDGLCWSRDEG